MTLDPPPGSAVVLVADDGLGIAVRVSAGLAARGWRPVLLGDSSPAGEAGDRVDGVRRVVVDLGDPDDVQSTVDRLRDELGRVTSLVHLASAAGGPRWDEVDLAGWRAALRWQVKSLYLLARALHADVGSHPVGWLLAATALTPEDGRPGEGPDAGGGGVAGLTRSLAEEWTARVRLLHLPEAPRRPERDAGTVLAEIDRLASGEQVRVLEVAHVDGRRVRPAAASRPATAPRVPMLPPDAVVLLTGGARGITAQVARELARHRPTLVLVGRSTLSDEAPEVAGCADARSLTSALTESALRAGDVPDLPTINRRVRDLLAAREVRGNLAALRATGAQVEYRSADLRDEQQVAALLRSVHQRYGRLDGVVHGAGVLEDRLVQDKEPASFDRVFDTKVDSAFALVRHLDPSGLRFLVFFTSVAGRFGNAGQTDYAAANEVLASLARDLNDRWPTRVVAMCWGPWAGGGMVTPEVQRRFLERGVEPLTPELGRRLFVDELERGSAGDAVVILGRGPWARRPSSGAGTTNPTPLPTPLPMRLRATADDDGRAVVDVVLDPHTDHYLRDHRLDGNPVLPAAVAAELCAEAVELVRPGELAAAVEDLALLHGVILTGDVPTRLVLTVAPDLQGRGDDRTWVVTLDQEDGPGAYRCGVVLADALPERVGPVVTTLAGRGAPTPPPKAAMYTEMLFHGPLLQGIDSVEAAGPLWQAAVHGVHPERFTARSPGGRWVLDPSLLDLAPQLAILWARATYGTTTLPVRWASVRRGPASGPDEGLSAVFRVREGADPSWLTADLDVLNADGSVRLSVEGLETVGTAALNRLASAGATS